jgi:hypothetical protein
MSVDHRVKLTPEQRADIVKQAARRKTTYAHAVAGALRDGEEPTPVPGKTWIRRSNDCAMIVACLGVIMVYAMGAPKVVAVLAGLLLGALGGALYFHSPRIASWLVDEVRYRKSQR